jgi:hypothetical protein
MVSWKFPKKFPGNRKSFLNPGLESALRKQETFDKNLTIHKGSYGFLGWKLFFVQETFGFLLGFLWRIEKWD